MTKIEFEARIKAIVARRVPSVQAKLEDAATPLGLDGLGLDSVQLAEILMLIEEEMGVSFPEDWSPEGQLSVEALARFVSEQTNG